MWNVCNQKTGKMRSGFEDQDDAENFIFDFFGEKAFVADCSENEKTVYYDFHTA